MLDIGKRRGLKLSPAPGTGALSRATRFIDGGRKRFLEYVQLAAQDGDESAKSFWIVFSELRIYEQVKVSFDDVCMAAGVRPSDLMATIVSSAMEHEQEAGDLVAAAMHTKVVGAMGKSALRISGKHAEIAQKDRHAFLQSRHFLPVPRNATMQVQVNANASANSQAAAAAKAEPSMPGFMDDVASLRAPKEQIQKELSGVVEADVADSDRVEW